jgi:hypothetical protein
MYSGTLKKSPFQPDPSVFRHEEKREEIVARFRENVLSPSEIKEPNSISCKEKKEPKSLAQLIEMISPEDSALVALIVFLLCDNSENDVVLLGILLYVLLSH